MKPTIARKALLTLSLLLVIALSYSLPGQAFDLLALGKYEDNYETIMVGRYDFAQKHLAVLSLPPNTLAAGQKDILAYQLRDGIPDTMDLINKLAGTGAEYYIIIDYVGARDVVDALGGVEFELNKRMVVDDGEGEPLVLKPGKQHLDGEEARRLLRYRQGRSPFASSEVEVMELQQRFLIALINKALSNKLKLVGAALKLGGSLETNLDLATILKLLFKGLDSGLDKIDYSLEVIPGSYEEYGDGYIYRPE
ncbi:MAG: LCP family protein [Halanaerobium sp.]|nr:LCP family protein [Halanaerobium sp.]